MQIENTEGVYDPLTDQALVGWYKFIEHVELIYH